MALSTKNQKAVLHILKANYDLDETEYREFLINNFNGIDSSTGLTEQQADYCIHLLNYTYNENYRQGYNKCLQHGNTSLLDQFTQKIEMKYERRITTVEQQLFEILDRDKQIEMINNI